MREFNPRLRPRERFELSLDGRQVASIVVGALVILAVVFVLGLNVGKQIAMRRSEAARAGDLDALDRAPAPAAPLNDDALTFHERLTKAAPPAPAPEVAKAPEAKAAEAPPAPAPQPSPPPVATAPAPAPAAARAPAPATAAPSGAAPARPGSAGAAQKPWTVQLAASQERAEAERIASKFSALNPRIEDADVPGRGRFYRVRVGSFESREEADRYLRDVARETGAKGFVTSSK